VFVSNERPGDLSLIDAEADSVVTRINAGTRPRGVGLSPNGQTVYVALSGSLRCPPTMTDAECDRF
jgi:YVTN family beta-propeller protein